MYIYVYVCMYTYVCINDTYIHTHFSYLSLPALQLKSVKEMPNTYIFSLNTYLVIHGLNK